MSDLIKGHKADSGPVECLGQQFPSDQARREHYLKLLAELLTNPQFRNRDGFPVGSDDAILALSDPPYFTACPNPFIRDFLAHHSRADDAHDAHAKEPFVADVSEGKYDPLYKLHPYHTKVPHKAIMRYILHYTNPGDVVFDGFCGTGMTGVAAQLCADKGAIEDLGYKVERDVIYRRSADGGGEKWVPFSKLGQRYALLNDLSPAATFIASKHNSPTDLPPFELGVSSVFDKVEAECGWMFRTLHEPSNDAVNAAVDCIDRSVQPELSQFGAVGLVNYVVWSDNFSCPECGGQIVFWNDAVDIPNGKIKEDFSCRHCGSQLRKRDLNRIWERKTDPVIRSVVTQAKLTPVRISYTLGRRRFEKVPDQADLALIAKIEQSEPSHWIPVDPIEDGFNTRQPKESHGVTRLHHFYTARTARLLGCYRAHCKSTDDLFLLTRVAAQLTLRYRFTYQNGSWGAGGGPMSGTLYIPSLIKELNPLEQLRQAESDQKKRLSRSQVSVPSVVSTSSSTKLEAMPDSSVDYIFIDPPFGSNIMYSDLNVLWEGWLRVFTNPRHEAIENPAQKKNLDDYRALMRECFSEAFRVLKPGRWMTVEFSNTQASVWNAIQISLQEAGFVVANVAALDKQKASFKATTTTTAVKQDLVISAYKPNGGLEERFSISGGSEESAWDFVRTHLNYIPVVKVRDGGVEFVSERDPRIIFDRMVAWFVRHGFVVPMSTHEFQSGLAEKFSLRDGMVFLSDQVTEYEAERARFERAPQMELFVSDERSAIDWLSDFLRKRPSTYQELHPGFISQLGAGWKKHESRPELMALLENNFLMYSGEGPIPKQIVELVLGGEPAESGELQLSPAAHANAMNRWYVPDPTRAIDLEKKREKALLKEFDGYVAATGRKLKEFRLEVLRAGFKTAWASRDYQTIIKVAQKIPEEALQEDEKLLLWYDQALTRVDAAN